MPFKSEKQRRFLWLKHPDIAKRWAHEYPESNKNLPMRVADKKDEHPKKDTSMDKAAMSNLLRTVLVKNSNINNLINGWAHSGVVLKAADSKLEQIKMPQSDKPSAAGERKIESILKPETEDEGSIGQERAETIQHIPAQNCSNPLLSKLAVVLAPKIQQEIENIKAQQQAREAQRIPQNVNVKQYPIVNNMIPPPMGMTAPPQQAPAQPQQQPQQQNGQMPPVGGGQSPNANPINAFGGLSSTGDINGNAALGTQNTAGGEKMAAKKCSCGCGQKVNECTCPPSCSCRQKGGSCYGLKKQASGNNPALAKITAITGGPITDPTELDELEDEMRRKTASAPAWQRSEGKNPEGGLNAKGRASYKAQTGGTLKAPVTESNPSGERAKRQNSFCSRMCGMKRVNTGASTAKDPDSRINKSLRKWNCKCSSAFEFGAFVCGYMNKQAMPRGLQDIPAGSGPDQIEDAILRYNQLRALVRPDDSTLKQYGLGRPAFQQALRKITSHSQDKDRFELRKVAPNPGLHAAVAGISSLALPAAAGYFGGPQAALATLPISGAAAGAAYVNASMKREGVKRTAKLLKQYGLLNPQLLRQAYPLLGDDYRIA